MTAIEEVPPAAIVRSKRRLPPVTVILAGAVLLIVVIMVVAPWIAPHDAAYVDPSIALQNSSAEHWFGTDQLGRDVLSRVIVGSRTAFLAPLVLAVCVVSLAVAMGIMAGIKGGMTDAAISRVVELLYSIPSLMVAIIVVGVTGGGFVMAVVVLIIFGVPSTFRLMRAAVMERLGLPYIEAARTLGLGTTRIIFTQLIPALFPLIVTAFFLQLTYGIVEISAMSFLGLGVAPGSPDWGRMMFENRAFIGSNVWATAAPGIIIVALAVSANVVGDWVYSRYEDAGRQR